MSTKTFAKQLHEICTELHDTGGYYLLSSEQFEAVERAHTTTLEAAKRETRQEELIRLRENDNFLPPVMIEIIDERIAQLSHPNQPKESQDDNHQ